MKVLVTGASGFVGQAAVETLANKYGHEVIGTSRHATHDGALIGELGPDTDWSPALTGCDVVLHLAARVHVMRDEAADPLLAFRLVNVDGTLNLARQAVAAGVRRFIFISSIKVNGEQTAPGVKFLATDTPRPGDPYGISKAEAEAGLQEVAKQTGMEVVIIRPPLIYGFGVKGNFSTMMHWLQSGLPLPLGAIRGNARSLVALDNLLDLIALCITHPAAANQIFLVSDNEDLSTTDLLRRLGAALGLPTRLIPAPPALLTLGAVLMGKAQIVQRLVGNLQVDISPTCQRLNWLPPISVEEGLRRAAKGKE